MLSEVEVAKSKCRKWSDFERRRQGASGTRLLEDFYFFLEKICRNGGKGGYCEANVAHRSLMILSIPVLVGGKRSFDTGFVGI